MKSYARAFPRLRIPLACLIVLMTAATAWQLPSLEYDEDPRTLYRTRDRNFRELEELFQDFGRDDLDCLIVLQGNDFLVEDQIQVVRNLVDRLSEIEGVAEVHSMLSVRRPFRIRSYYLPLIPAYKSVDAGTLRRVRREAENHPLLRGGLLSADRRTATVHIRLSEDYSQIAQLGALVGEVRKVTRDVVDVSPTRGTVTGLPVLRLDHLRAMRRDQVWFNLIGTALAILVAAIVFRNLASVLIVMGGPTLGTVWTIGVLHLCGQQINLLNVVIPPIMLAVGLANAIHFLVEYQRQRLAHRDRFEATAESIRRVGPACGLAAITTAMGFGSLALANAEMIRNFGLGAALGCGLTVLAVLGSVPLLTSSRLGDMARSETRLIRTSETAWLGRLLTRMERLVPLLAGAGLLATLVCLSSAAGLTADNRLTESSPRGEPSLQALRHLDQTFGGSMATAVVLQWPAEQSYTSGESLAVLGKVEEAVAGEPSFGDPLSLLSLLKSISPTGSSPAAAVRRLRYLPSEQIRKFMNPERRRALLQFRVPDAGAAKLEPRFARLSSQLDEIARQHPGYELRLTGTPVVAFANIRGIIQTLYRSIALAAVLVFVSVTVFCRSLWMGCLSILPNTFPLGVVTSVIWLTGGRLEIASVVVFSVCLGIATDDTIHFLARYQRERSADHDDAAAVRRTVAHLAQILTITTLVMGVGFGSVLASNQPALQVFSRLALVGLAAALIGDLVLLPALLFTLAARRSAHAATDVQ